MPTTRRSLMRILPFCGRSVKDDSNGDDGTSPARELKKNEVTDYNEPSPDYEKVVKKRNGSFISDSPTLHRSPSIVESTRDSAEDEEARYLLAAAGFDIAAMDFNSKKALHFAARQGLDTCVRLLLDSGASLSLKTEDFTPLLTASKYGHAAAAKLMIQRGADMTARDYRGMTPLLWASTEGALELVRFLLDQGCSVEEKAKHDFTPLSQAAYTGKKDIAALLLQRGANIKATCDFKETALHSSAKACRREVLELLIEHGADVGARNKAEQTPLHVAASAGHEEIVTVLLGKGADPFAKDKNGALPLHLAAKNKHKATVQLLREHMPSEDFPVKSKWSFGKKS